MSFELLTKDELLEKIFYKYQFSEIHQDENIKNTILNNYDKKYISNIEYAHNEFCNKFKEIEEAITLSISISFYKIFTVMLLVFSTIILFLKITLGSINIIRDIENKTKMFFMLLFNIFICFLLFYLVIFLVDYIYKSLNLY